MKKMNDDQLKAAKKLLDQVTALENTVQTASKGDKEKDKIIKVKENYCCICYISKGDTDRFPANINLFKVTIETLLDVSDVVLVFFVNFEHISHLFLVFLLLTWNKQLLTGLCLLYFLFFIFFYLKVLQKLRENVLLHLSISLLPQDT